MAEVEPPATPKKASDAQPPAQLKQLLETKPQRVIKFMGPYDTNVPKTINMEITNPSEYDIAWRMLVTAPSRYIVTPKAGIILSEELITIEVTIKGDQANETMEDDKFRLEAFILPDDATTDAAAIWPVIDPTDLMVSLFIVYFGMPEVTLAPHNLHFDREAPLPKLWLGPEAHHFRHPEDASSSETSLSSISSSSEVIKPDVDAADGLINSSTFKIHVSEDNRQELLLDVETLPENPQINIMDTMLLPIDEYEALIHLFSITFAAITFSTCFSIEESSLAEFLSKI